MFPRSLVILGSTGSIGRNALAVVAAQPGRFSVQGLACGRNVRLLAEQAAALRPPFLAVLDEEARHSLEKCLPAGYRPEIFVGSAGYAALAGIPEATTVLSAQSGAAGLSGTLAACLAGKVVCLANKESLVLAGSLVRDICGVTGASVLPVDSEHNAVFQCLAGRGADVESIVLTASGGPFRGRTREELAHVTLEEALHHPNWSMGRKITIDSATMMNKGLEIIEAFHLYGMPCERIGVLVHPQSVVHSLVRLKDGALLAQLGAADMRLPLANCLLWPRLSDVQVAPLDLTRCGTLSFQPPDTEAFPCLALARRALAERGGMCVVLNAANEAAVDLFVQGRCTFSDIPRLIARALDAHAGTGPGHSPFCPPLGDVADGGRLHALVGELEARIADLDSRTRALVQNCKCGETQC